jgi:hypothetical protein
MLEEFVMTDEVSDDVGESMMVRDDDFEPPEVPFQPKPTSVSIAALSLESASTDFSGDSNFTTMPKVDRPADIHRANTMILEGRGRNAPPLEELATPVVDEKPPKRQRGKTMPPPPPKPRKPQYDEALHSAPTMIIAVGRPRRRQG